MFVKILATKLFAVTINLNQTILQYKELFKIDNSL